MKESNADYRLGFEHAAAGRDCLLSGGLYSQGYNAGRLFGQNSPNGENSPNGQNSPNGESDQMVKAVKLENPHFRHGPGGVRGFDWDRLKEGWRETRNAASDTAKMCHPIIAPMRGDKPFRGDRVPKTMNYCSDDTYGMPVV